MAAIKGEIRVPCGGRIWTMCLDFNALCDFEEETGRNAIEVLAAIEGGEGVRLSDMRVLVHCALRRHHPDATLIDAGDVVQASPDALAEAMTAAAPPAPSGSDTVGSGKKTRSRGRPA